MDTQDTHAFFTAIIMVGIVWPITVNYKIHLTVLLFSYRIPKVGCTHSFSRYTQMVSPILFVSLQPCPYFWTTNGVSDIFKKFKKTCNCLSILFSEMWHHAAMLKLTFLRYQLPLSSWHRKYNLITTKLYGVIFQMWKLQISFWLLLLSQLHTPTYFKSQ